MPPLKRSTNQCAMTVRHIVVVSSCHCIVKKIADVEISAIRVLCWAWSPRPQYWPSLLQPSESLCYWTSVGTVYVSSKCNWKGKGHSAAWTYHIHCSGPAPVACTAQGPPAAARACRFWVRLGFRVRLGVDFRCTLDGLFPAISQLPLSGSWHWLLAWHSALPVVCQRFVVTCLIYCQRQHANRRALTFFVWLWRDIDSSGARG